MTVDCQSIKAIIKAGRVFFAVMGRDHSEGDGLWVLLSETDVYMMKML